MGAPLFATLSLHWEAVVLRLLRAAENPLNVALLTMLMPDRPAALVMGFLYGVRGHRYLRWQG